MGELTAERLAEKRRIAEAATPGPWWVDGWEARTKDGDRFIASIAPAFQGASPDASCWEVDANIQHIAAFDPTTALAMLDEIERLRREISVQQTTLENLRSALVAEGHEPGCPVVWGHSVDCVPGTCIETRTYRATYGEKGGGE